MFTKQGEFTKKVTDLTDVPSQNLPPSEIKSYFQTPPDELKGTLNRLVDDLTANTGATGVGAKETDNTDSTVQALLNKRGNDLTTHKTAAELDHPDESVTTRKIKDGAVTREKIASGAIGTNELDPAILAEPTTAFGQQAKFAQIDSSLAESKTQLDSNVRGIQVPYFVSGSICGWVDDNTPSTFLTTLKTLCDTYNFKVGLAVVTGQITNSGQMSVQDLLNMQSQGHEVYSHSVTHDPNLWYSGNLINTSPSILTTEIKNSQQWLKDNGFTTWDTFIYPGGGYTQAEVSKIRLLVSQYYRYGINSVGNYSTFPIDNLYVPRLGLDAGTSFASIQASIDQAIAKNAMFIILTHSGGVYYDGALTEQVIQYIQSKGVPIMPARQALEIKGNALAIGDGQNPKTSNRFFVGKDGQVTLPVKFLDGESPISNSLDFTSPLNAFPPYCESRMFCRNTTDTLTNEGGILSTFYSWVGSWYNKQEFVSSGTFKKYSRSWNETTNLWNAWVSTSAPAPQVVFNAIDSIPITTGGNTTYQGSTITITPYSDSYATANGLPTGGGGVCTTYRVTSSQTTIQEYRPNFSNNSDYVWVRHWYNNVWSPWIRKGGSYGATNARPQVNQLGYMHFNSDYQKPTFIKSYGTAEVDTLTVSAGATTSGNITISLNGANTTIAVTAGDSASTVASKINSTYFVGWTSTVSGSVVTFTKQTAGTNTAPTFTDTGSTGITASFAVTTAGVNNTFVDADGVVVGNNGVNKSVSASATTLTVTFTTAEFDANYAVNVSPSWNTTYWITNKATSGFTINFGTAPSSASTLDWSIKR